MVDRDDGNGGGRREGEKVDLAGVTCIRGEGGGEKEERDLTQGGGEDESE